MDNAYLGIDIGTSGCRVIAIDEHATIISHHQQSLRPSSPQPLTSEHDPDYLWNCVLDTLLQAVSQCQNHIIQAIAVDATSGSILISDQHGQPVSPLLMYNDARAIEQSKLIASIAPKESAAHGSSSGLAKLLYLQQKYTIPKQSKLMHQVDWINFKLGAPLGVTDYNNALKTGYDPVVQCWPDWIDTLTDTSLLPEIVAPGTTIGQLSVSLCQQFNLNYSPKLIAGTTDSIAALIATGANQAGDAVTSLGSTLVVKLIGEQPLFLPEYGVYSHRLGDKWLIGGASNTGGAVLNHYFTNQQLRQLSQHISLDQTPADYYPLLSPGERFPISDPSRQPKLTPRSNDDVEFLYGMLAGMAKIEQHAYHILQKYSSTTLKTLRTVGGGAKNSVWQAIRQRYLTLPFLTPNHTEAAYGAALIAKGTLSP